MKLIFESLFFFKTKKAIPKLKNFGFNLSLSFWVGNYCNGRPLVKTPHFLKTQK
jgi:hypothetical protein